MDKPVCIVIPTFNRAHSIDTAINAALSQSHTDVLVIVIDDASTDGTAAKLEAFTSDPRVCSLRLGKNMGTASAKNVGIMLAGDRTVTFHDSDDIPHRDKVLRQSRILNASNINADPCLNWSLAGTEPESRLQVGAVLTHHALILPDGRRVEVRRAISLIDDVFPNLQLGSTVPGDWTHVNSGLFHPGVFERIGGFTECIEEDREFRNRLILSGEIVWLIDDILMTKIETADSLTQSTYTDYQSARRISDRDKVWAKVEHWFATRQIAPEPIHLPALLIEDVSQPHLLRRSNALCTDQTDARFERLFPQKQRYNA